MWKRLSSSSQQRRHEPPHSTGPLLLLAFTPALLMCSQGSLAQFLNSCSMAIWRTCSSDANESFSCTAAVSSSKTSVEGEREREAQHGNQRFCSHTRSTHTQTNMRETNKIKKINNSDYWRSREQRQHDRKGICLRYTTKSKNKSN